MEFQNIEELKKLRVVDLKERLSKLGKSTSGLKADLVDRLYNALAEKSGQVDLSAAAPSYVQMCNISSMEPEPPVVEVTIDTSQFDMSVQEPQIVTMGQYNVIDDGSQINVQHQINEQVYYQSSDESEQLHLQQEDLWRQQQDQLLRQQQQQEAAERYQQQEFERQEMMERQELERITAAEEEAAAAAERMRVMEEQELEMNRVREVEEERERQAEAQRLMMEEEYRLQQQQREEEELMRRRYEEEQQQQREFERQRELELTRQRELEMEMERQRQTEELERQLQMEAERQRELDRERQRELQLERQREAELERQREEELERQRDEELERQREAELERQREAEFARQREEELDRQREAELERQRVAELERQREVELEREREAELERDREAELARQREAELERQAELRERQLMEMEIERQREIELLRQKEAERQKELELQKEAEEEERQREMERQELQRKRAAVEKEEERLRELEKQKALEREKEFERQRIAAQEEEARRKKEYEAEMQKKKQEEEQMHQIYQEQLRKEKEEQTKREEEFQKRQEFQKKVKELEEEELRQSLIAEAKKKEVSQEKMDQDDEIQEIPRPEKEKVLIMPHSTSVITHTGNAQNFPRKISHQTNELEEINNSKNKKNLDSAETNQNGDDEKKESQKEKLSKNQKRKIKKKKRQNNRKEQSEKRNNILNSEEEPNENKNTSDVSVEIQYVGDEVDLKPTDPMYFHFMKIFENFKLVDPEQAKREAEEAALKAKLDAKKEPDLRKKPKDADEEPELETKKDEQPKLSKRKLKQLTRLSIAELKQHVNRPDVVEMHDVTAKDPKLLVLLKSTRNTVPVPRHWCFKRKFLQGKRGIEKPPFNLPEFIKKTGIMEMRQALQEKEDQKTLKAKMREKVRPKMGKIDIDYQKLHDAFFKWQTKPRMTIHGDLYYEGKEYETRLKEKKPGELSDDLRTALGMPVGPGCQKIPPPWLIAMQRYGPPPSYPNLKVPGLNSPIPDGCSFGYHAGGWGKPPVDELGRPLYGDVFGTTGSEYSSSMPEEEVDRSQWGELESESESEEEEGEEEEEEEGAEGEEMEIDKEGGIATPAEGGLATPSGLSSVSMGMETPDMIELRKRKIENEMDNAENPTLYQVLAEKKPDRMSGLMMGSTHVYDISSAMPPKVRTSVSHLGGDGGVDVALDPSELDMDQATMASRYEQTLREQRMGLEKEDLSDMVAEHTAKQKNKRKRATNTTGSSQPQDANRSAKKYKDFKF